MYTFLPEIIVKFIYIQFIACTSIETFAKCYTKSSLQFTDIIAQDAKVYVTIPF